MRHIPLGFLYISVSPKVIEEEHGLFDDLLMFQLLSNSIFFSLNVLKCNTRT